MVHILLPLVEIIYFTRPVKNFAESTSIFHVIGEGRQLMENIFSESPFKMPISFPVIGEEVKLEMKVHNVFFAKPRSLLVF